MLIVTSVPLPAHGFRTVPREVFARSNAVRNKEHDGGGVGDHYLMIWNWSSLLARGADLRGYWGLRASLRVLGRWKVVLVLTLVDFFDRRPAFTA